MPLFSHRQKHIFSHGVTRIISIHRRQKQASKLSKHEVQNAIMKLSVVQEDLIRLIKRLWLWTNTSQLLINTIIGIQAKFCRFRTDHFGPAVIPLLSKIVFNESIIVMKRFKCTIKFHLARYTKVENNIQQR